MGGELWEGKRGRVPAPPGEIERGTEKGRTVRCGPFLELKFESWRRGSGDGLGGDSFGAFFAGADADGFFDVRDEDFAIADLSGIGGADDGVGDITGAVVIDDDFDFDFGEEVDRVFAAAIDFGVTFLTAETFDLGDGHALYADAGEGFLHVFEFEWFDNGFDFLHWSYSWLDLEC
jgi:hypothetical protein